MAVGPGGRRPAIIWTGSAKGTFQLERSIPGPPPYKILYRGPSARAREPEVRSGQVVYYSAEVRGHESHKAA